MIERWWANLLDSNRWTKAWDGGFNDIIELATNRV